ncbi:MAG: hypothetical protein KGS72_21515 [Cyanobacteria bacterium REEB67]|nr:hypothetical protein [Cyanobacteria bacterium REEB67]
MTDNRKAELIQLRVEKTFLDKLNRIAEKQNLPLSAMLRVWLSDRLNEEMKMITTERKVWQEERLAAMKAALEKEFEPGPAFAVHAHPLTPGVSIDIANVEKNAFSLIPWGSTGFTGRIKQHGYELIRAHNGRSSAKAQIFTSGQIEGLFAVSTEGKEIYGLALDDGIVQVISAYVGLLRSQQTPMPYQFNVFILNAQGYAVVEDVAGVEPTTAFEDSVVRLTPLVIDTPTQTESELQTGNHCREMIDELWRAAGKRHSASYDKDNQWLVRRGR